MDAMMNLLVIEGGIPQSPEPSIKVLFISYLFYGNLYYYPR